MFILLSPSKSMHKLAKNQSIAMPQLQQKTMQIVDELAAMSRDEIKQTLRVSDSIAELNFNRYQMWGSLDAFPALWLYAGDVYKGFDAVSCNVSTRYLHDHLGIISGLYGLVRTDQPIRPYRLEFSTKLPGLGNLYSYWGDSIAKQVQVADPEGPYIVCASAEYARSVTKYLPKDSVITPRFMQSTMTGLREKGLFAKYHRGAFARWCMETGATRDDLDAYNHDGAVYAKKFSTPNSPVYILPDDYSLKGKL